MALNPHFSQTAQMASSPGRRSEPPKARREEKEQLTLDETHYETGRRSHLSYDLVFRTTLRSKYSHHIKLHNWEAVKQDPMLFDPL